MESSTPGRRRTGPFHAPGAGRCSSRSAEPPPPPNPDEVRAKIVRLMPATVRDRQRWAKRYHAAFSAQQIYPSDENLCAVLAVTEQESTYPGRPRRWPAWAGSPPARSSVVPASCTCGCSWSARR
ncbi:DUF1615 family protein [Pseudomonas aeruginosa]